MPEEPMGRWIKARGKMKSRGAATRETRIAPTAARSGYA